MSFSPSKIKSIKLLIIHDYFPIILLICINLVIGALLVTDYGESWDEHLRYRYAENSINAYRGIPGDLEDEKGPFFVMFASLGSKFLCSFSEGCFVSDARHFINFLSFLLGLFFLYRLNLRFTNKWAALGGTLLFNTQPLLWGHAFINPKDLPFMAFFIASIDTGIAMVDSFRLKTNNIFSDSPNKTGVPLRTQIATEWQQFSQTRKRAFIIASVILFSAIICLFVFEGIVQNWMESLILDIYNNNSISFIENIFFQQAEKVGEIPIESYIQKAWNIYALGIRYFSLFIIFIWITTFLLVFSDTRRIIFREKLKSFIHLVLDNFRSPQLITAGIFLGLTCSIRTLGPAAGGLIVFYLIAKYKRFRFSILLPYFLIAAITTYISWPGLWGAPIQNYLDSLLVASDFPWEGQVLFSGIYYSPDSLPKSYLPVLLSIQFTMTALAAIIFGFILTISKSIKNELDRAKVGVLVLWFFIPLMLVMIIAPSIYDNFRHFLFIISPLFIFASVGLQVIFNKVRLPALKAGIIALIIFPNILSLVSLHPYQYIYYNIFTDGVHGAFRNFEMDYWGTSYRKATEYINQIAPINSKIVVYGAPHLVKAYARTDLEIERYKKDSIDHVNPPNFAILLSRYDKDIQVYPDVNGIFFVERNGAILAVVKDLSDNNLDAP